MSAGVENALRDLSPKQRLFVTGMLKGMSQIAAATAAGYSSPKQNAHKVANDEKVRKAMEAATKAMAEEVGFSRKEAHDMLMQAWQNTATAAEQVQVMRELVQLHGLRKPAAAQKVEHVHEVTHQHEVKMLTDEQLMKLAKLPHVIDLEESDYEVSESDG